MSQEKLYELSMKIMRASRMVILIMSRDAGILNFDDKTMHILLQETMLMLDNIDAEIKHFAQ